MNGLVWNVYPLEVWPSLEPWLGHKELAVFRRLVPGVLRWTLRLGVLLAQGLGDDRTWNVSG